MKVSFEVASMSTYKEGKQEALEVLKEVLESMKSPNGNPTSDMMNRIFDEIYSKVSRKLK